MTLSMTRAPFALSLFLTISASAAINTSVSVDATSPGPVINRQTMTGTCLPIWNSPQVYQEIKKGLQTSRYSLFRFPNGSLSNDYHWNGQGAYDADKIWVCDSVTYKPGFQDECAYRGTSKSNYGFIGTSNITDGDTATMWWSDPGLTEKPAFFYLELAQAQRVDSVVILWGERPAVDFEVDCWSAVNAPYPGPHVYFNDLWVTRDSVTGNASRTYANPLTYDAAIKYLRVVIGKTRGDSGAQVREVYLYRNDTLVSVNTKKYGATSGNQTRVVAVGTHAGNKTKSGSSAWDFETFMAYVGGMGYEAEPVICVNYGTGTPQEAAAWVHYANVVKKYGVKYWQVGNEMDGDWEEGGPVTARMYAERFVAYAKAMKAQDPSIKVFGPVASNAAFDVKGSGDFDDKSWMESFVAYVGAREKSDGTKYLDGIDFHSYPYWSSSPQLYAMMPKADYVNDRLDSLKNWIARHLASPDSTAVFMSEYNASVSMSQLIQWPANGVFCANMYAGLAEKFAGRAMAVVWDSYEGGDLGPDNTWGSLSLFNGLPGAQYSSFSKAPSAVYWGLYMASSVWLSPESACVALPATFTRADGVRVYAARTGSDLRLLILNVGFDTAVVTPAVTGASYSTADVYTWSERQFTWNGRDRSAFASPNCGPSSRRVPAAALTTVTVPQLSIVVVRYHNSGPSAGPQGFVHLGLKNANIRMPDSLVAYGTAAGARFPVKEIGWSVDSRSSFTTVSSLDGAFDGPTESFRAASLVQGIASGSHVLYVRAMDSAGTSVIDSVPFQVTGQLRPVVMIDNFEDGDFITILPDSGRWLSFAAGRNETSVTPVVDTVAGGGRVYTATFTIVQPPAQGYDNYVSILTRIDTSYLGRHRGWFKGLAFSYASRHSAATGGFTVSMLTGTVRDYADYAVTLENTGGAWRTVNLAWSDFKQPSWGAQMGPLQTQDINGIEFRAIKAGEGVFRFDNVMFLADSGQEIRPGVIGLLGGSRPGAGLTCRKWLGGYRFAWTAASAERQSVAVYDSQGCLVHASAPLPGAAGSYVWDRRDREGRRAGPGMYLVMVRQGPSVRSQAFMAVK